MSVRYMLTKSVWKKCAVKSISVTEQKDLSTFTSNQTHESYLKSSLTSLNPENSILRSYSNTSNPIQTNLSSFKNNLTLHNVVNFNSLSKNVNLSCFSLSNTTTQKRNYSDKKSTTDSSETIKSNTTDQQKTSILSSVFTQDEASQANSETKDSSNKSDKKSEDSKNEDSDKKEKDDRESAFLRSQRYAKWVLLGSFGILTPMFIINNGQPKHDEMGEVIPDEYSQYPLVSSYIRRAWGELNLLKREIVEPSFQKLLPDPLQEPYYQPPYTLVIELMDVLLRPVYDSVTGWRFKKRPGIEYFLSQIGPPHYEIVIFTRETGMTAYPLIESMDSKGYIMYRLFRDAARYKSGFSLGNPLDGKMPKLDPYYQKDLTFLNRDLSKVVMVDCDKRAFEKQPSNGLYLEKWDGSSNDSTLYDLANFLQMVATSEVGDVRPVLKHYSNYEDPLEAFKQAQDVSLQSQVRPTPKSSMFGAGSTISTLIKRR